MSFIEDNLNTRLTDFFYGNRKLTVLTGAGLSADSGIPTFRDKDGFWTVGSVNYTPEEMGTLKMFKQKPLDVWKWFLYRQGICSTANPNRGHFAIKQLEDIFKERFQLITQNVDGLHFKAGSAHDRAFLIHGSLEYARCGDECSNELFSFPAFSLDKGQELSDEQIALLKCPKCDNYMRPHVLWFDEYYNEAFYKLDSSMRVAKQTGLLLIVGTSGATTLPLRIAERALSRQAIIIDINPNENYFSKMLDGAKNGYSLKGSSSDVLPEFVELFESLAGTRS